MTTNGITAVAALQLPIFDISDPTPEVGRSMIEAAAKYGFLYVDTKGTDFTEAIVDRQFELVSDLSLMAPQKRTDEYGSSRRNSSPLRELKKKNTPLGMT